MADTTNTTTVEGLDFVAHDHASAPAGAIAKAFEGVHHASQMAGEKVKQFGQSAAMGALGAVGLGLGLRELYSHAKEANLELEHATKQIAGVHFAFQHWRSDVPVIDRWHASMSQAAEITEKLDVAEGKLKIRRVDLAGIYSAAFAIGSKHNLGQTQMLDLTEKLGAAQKVLGVSAEGASMQITRMAMTGNLRGFDKFAVQMRQSITNMKEFHKLSEAKRFEKIQKAMGDLVPAAVEMGKGMEGSMFTLRETVEQLFRDFTGPLFKQQSASLAEWAAKITKIRDDGQSIAKVWGEKLVTAFGYLKSATAFIAEHWKAIALIWASSKMPGWMAGVGGMFGTGAGAAEAANPAKMTAAEISRWLRPGLADTTKGLAQMGAKLGMVTEGLALLYLGADALAEWMLAEHKKGMDQVAAAPRAMDAMTAGAKAYSAALHGNSDATVMAHLKSAFSAYGLKPGQMLSSKTVAGELKGLDPAIAAKQLAMYGIPGVTAKSVQMPGFIDENVNKIVNALNGLAAELVKTSIGKDEKPLTNKNGPPVTNIANVNITQDFKEADPDRVFHKVINEINQVAHNPRGASTGARGVG